MRQRALQQVLSDLIFDEVLVPWDRVFMFREVEFAGEMVSRFSAFHRQSHGGCKSGKIDAMSGAALMMMEYSGTAGMSHHKEKVIDMLNIAETLYGCSLAASYEGKREPSGTYFIDPILANASKIHEGREMAEAIRLMIDITGGYVADLPSDSDFNHPEIGGLLKKYLKGAANIPVEDRVRMLRLVEKMAMESADTISDIHGGGSPAAHTTYPLPGVGQRLQKALRQATRGDRGIARHPIGLVKVAKLHEPAHGASPRLPWIIFTTPSTCRSTDTLPPPTFTSYPSRDQEHTWSLPSISPSISLALRLCRSTPRVCLHYEAQYPTPPLTTIRYGR